MMTTLLLLLLVCEEEGYYIIQVVFTLERVVVVFRTYNNNSIIIINACVIRHQHYDICICIIIDSNRSRLKVWIYWYRVLLVYWRIGSFWQAHKQRRRNVKILKKRIFVSITQSTILLWEEYMYSVSIYMISRITSVEGSKHVRRLYIKMR